MNERDVVEKFLKKNYLVSPCFLNSYEEDEGFLVDIDEKLKGKEKHVL